MGGAQVAGTHEIRICRDATDNGPTPSLERDMSMTRCLLFATAILSVTSIAVAADTKVFPGSYCMGQGGDPLGPLGSGEVVLLNNFTPAICGLLRDLPGTSKLPLVEASLEFGPSTLQRQCFYFYRSVNSEVGGFVVKVLLPGGRNERFRKVDFADMNAVPNGPVAMVCDLRKGDKLLAVKYSE